MICGDATIAIVDEQIPDPGIRAIVSEVSTLCIASPTTHVLCKQVLRYFAGDIKDFTLITNHLCKFMQSGLCAWPL